MHSISIIALWELLLNQNSAEYLLDSKVTNAFLVPKTAAHNRGNVFCKAVAQINRLPVMVSAFVLSTI